METKKYKYDAFISYRHVEPDQSIAARLHTMLETFTLPKNMRKKGENQKFRVFRDREELSAADLTDSIQDALKHSKNLIVICTRQTPLSPWCAKEIETFRKYHGDSNIIAVLAEGEPDESFPPSLLDLKKELTLEDGTTEFVERELLAAELRPEEVQREDFPGYAKFLAENSPRLAGLTKQSTGLLKTEIFRIVAGMLGVSFGDLKQRDRERRLRRTLQLVSAGAAVMLVFGIVMLNLYWRADAAELQSTQQSSLMTMSRAMESVEAGDRMTGALIGQVAMDAAREEMPEYERLQAQYAGVLNDALYTDAYETTSVLDTGHTSPFFSATGDLGRILTSGEGNAAVIWDLQTGEALQSLAHPMPVFSLALSADGTKAYTGALDGNLYEWDAGTGENLRVIPLHDGAGDIRPTADNQTMVAARMDGGIDLWNIETDEIVTLELPENRRLHRAAIHPDGTEIVVSLRSQTDSVPVGEVLSFSLATGEPIRSYDLGPNDRSSEFNSEPKFSSDGSVLVLTTPKGILTVSADGTEQRIEDPSFPSMIDYAVSADGKTLYAPANSISESNVLLWDLQTGEMRQLLQGGPGMMDRIAVSADGLTVATSRENHDITLWRLDPSRLSAREEAITLSGHSGRITGLRFSEDSRYLLSGAMDGSVRITPTAAMDDGEIIQGAVTAASFDHRHVLLQWSDENYQPQFAVRAWDGTVRKAKGLDTADVLTSFRISADGKTVAHMRTGYQNAALVDTETGETLRTTAPHTMYEGSINALVDLKFSPDGTELATLGEDGVIKRIAVDTGRVLGEISGIPSGNVALRYAEDGAVLAVETMSGKTLLYTKEGEMLGETDGALHEIWPEDGGYAGVGLSGDLLFSWHEDTGAQPIAQTRDRRGISDRQLNRDEISADRAQMLSVVENQVVITDMRTGERLRTLETAGSVERYGTFSPDGQQVIYTYGDGTSKVIRLHGLEELSQTLSDRLGTRRLNEKELQVIGR